MLKNSVLSQQKGYICVMEHAKPAANNIAPNLQHEEALLQRHENDGERVACWASCHPANPPPSTLC